MFKGYWYDIQGKEVFTQGPLDLVYDDLEQAIETVLRGIPNTELLSKTRAWALIGVENNRRMLICSPSAHRR